MNKILIKGFGAKRLFPYHKHIMLNVIAYVCGFCEDLL